MKLSDAEWTVMHVLWERSPASARDVLERIGKQTGWAYTTVKTILTRLAEKGVLRERKGEGASLYSPRISRNSARRSAVRSLLDKAFDGAFGTLLQHMAAEERLSPRERAELEAMLERLDREEER